MNDFVAVTGATGHVGKALVERLLGQRVRVRAIGRQMERLSPLVAMGADARAGDLTDVNFTAEAFRDAQAVFLMIPPHYDSPDMYAEQRRTAASLVQALKRSEVPYAVALSSVGASLHSGTGPIAGLHAFEEMLKDAPAVAVVVLRAAYFMENHLGAIPLIRSAGVMGTAIRCDTQLPMVATRDIASAAAAWLSDPAFKGYSVREVLGPRDYTMCGATAILGAAIGNPDLPYTEFTTTELRDALTQAGFSPSVADGFVEMQQAFNAGTIQETYTRKPSSSTQTTLEEFARDVFAPAYYRQQPASNAQQHAAAAHR